MTDNLTTEGYSARSYYRGEVARRYERARQTTPSGQQKWHHEDRALRDQLRHLPPGATVLDAPCGTGRFAPVLAEYGLRSIGVDISRDMLRLHQRATPEGPASGRLLEADLERLPLADDAVDHVVAMRFFNLVPLDVAERVLREFARVARTGAILEVRLARQRPWDGPLRKVRRQAAALKPGARRATVTGLPAGREPLRIHPASAFMAAVRSAGWRAESVTDVLPNPLGLQPDNLQLVVVRRAR
jgi:ubiquinone/menaquinone biosynthesis C-methylase UbiE